MVLWLKNAISKKKNYANQVEVDESKLCILFGFVLHFPCEHGAGGAGGN